MVSLIDTNVIVRFLVGDHEEHLKQSIVYFKAIEKGELEVEILESVLMEALFVLTKFYKLPRQEIVSDLKAILNLDGVVNQNKLILFEALTLHDIKNIDFVDALICSKSKLEGYGKISFDRDVTEKCQ